LTGLRLLPGVYRSEQAPPRDAGRDAAFQEFVETVVQRLRRALVARYGVDVGNDVCADALAYAWEHWTDVAAMRNPTGYLYRVAQSAARRHHRWRRRPTFPPESAPLRGETEPGLDKALARLSEAHRISVLLVHAYGWTYEETAELLGVPVSTVRNHLHRGMKKLRGALGVEL
jgi:RNA polymerase sigma factor (sigma-70 family)